MGCEDVLQRIVDVLPPPSGDSAKPLRALVFDNFMDDYRGVVSLVAIIDGTIQKGSKLTFMRSGKSFEVATLGVLYPDEVQTKSLQAGQVGFITCGMKDNADGTSRARISSVRADDERSFPRRYYPCAFTQSRTACFIR